MSTNILDEQRTRAPRVFFAYGFRPFFLLAGVSAAVLVPLWVCVLTGTFGLGGSVPPSGWHAHEMLFGFAAAAVAGFLLTAIPSWTGTTAVSGPPLMGLVALYLAGRVASLPVLADHGLAAAVDLAFLPALGALVAGPLVRAGKARNTAFLALLALLTAANALFRLEWLGVTVGTAQLGIALAIGVVLQMVAVIGGRIVPSFTQNALRIRDPGVVIKPLPKLERAVLVLTALLIPADLLLPGSAVAGGLALAAAAAHGVRLSRWKGYRTLGQPVLWILHAGYAWIVVALALKGLEFAAGLPLSGAWLHALTAGAFTTMILGVMTRAALGHTGRAIVVSRTTAAAYVLVLLAGLARTLLPMLPDGAWLPLVHAAGALWTLGFALFLWVYGPILTGPRADGRPG
ncbi:MAG TPA: NnrS family protein [Azospirillum sp.]|nr:NnrS family protein [Azospirillum sp.]